MSRENVAVVRRIVEALDADDSTRCTMRNLRLRRLFWAKWRRRPGCRTAEETWELLKDTDLNLVIPIDTELATKPASVP